jgi:hypothetical protein
MKKLFCYFLFIFTFISCQEDIKFNTPTFQGVKDNEFWRAVSYEATLSNTNALTLKAYTRNEIVTLKTNSIAINRYVLGTDTSNTATYEITNKTETMIFSTRTNFGNGEIVISEYDAVNKTVSGTFIFNIDSTENNPLFASSVNFQNGFFYKIPIN